MFFIPLAIFQGSTDISVGYYIWKSMIPSGLGNIVGGGLFVGVAYCDLQGTEVTIYFDNHPVHTAIYEQAGRVSENASMTANSANVVQSGIAADLHGSRFARKEASGSDGSAV